MPLANDANSPSGSDHAVEPVDEIAGGREGRNRRFDPCQDGCSLGGSCIALNRQQAQSFGPMVPSRADRSLNPRRFRVARSVTTRGLPVVRLLRHPPI
jgi:hypothetical protein